MRGRRYTVENGYKPMRESMGSSSVIRKGNNITQIDYEPWHLRYVGVEVATYIEEHEVTFEEFLDEAKNTSLVKKQNCRITNWQILCRRTGSLLILLLEIKKIVNEHKKSCWWVEATCSLRTCLVRQRSENERKTKKQKTRFPLVFLGLFLIGIAFIFLK